MKIYDITNWHVSGISEVEGEVHPTNDNCFVATDPKRFIFDRDKVWFTDRAQAKAVLAPLVEAKYHKLQKELLQLSKLMNDLGIR